MTRTTGNVITTVETDEGDDVGFLSLDFADADGEIASYIKIVDLPDNGTLRLDNSTLSLNQRIIADDLDNLRYHPDEDFDGTDTFSVRFSDDGSNYDTSDSNVVINVINENDAPEFGRFATVSVAEGEMSNGVGVAIAAAFEDVDSDDYLSEAKIDFHDGDYGKLTYISDFSGTEISIDEEDEAVLSASELATLEFVADDDALDETEDDKKVDLKVWFYDSEGEETDDYGEITIKVTDGDDAPDFGSSDFDEVIDVEENETYFGDINPATDEESNYLLTYSITGTDASHFNVDPNNGMLSFAEAPDFEDPQDRNGDNLYSFVLYAEDESGNTASTAVEVRVTDVEADSDDWGLETASATIDEETTDVMTLFPELLDTSNEVTFSIGAASDKQNDLFEIDSSGVLSFKDEPDAENAPSDVSGGVYTVDVVLTDEDELQGDSGDGDPLDPKTVTVTVAVEDVHDADPSLIDSTPISDVSGSASVDVGSATGSLSFKFDEKLDTASGDTNLLTLKFNNGEFSGSLNGSPDLSFTLESTADTDADVNDFTVSAVPSGSTVTATIAIAEDAEFDFESLDDNGEFQLTLKVTDNDDGTTAKTVVDVEVIDVNEKPELTGTPNDLEVSEGDLVKFGEEATENVEDPEEAELLFELVSASATFDSKNAKITFNGSSDVSYSADYHDVDFQVYYEVGGTLVEYTGQYLTMSQAESLTLDADFARATLASNPLVSLKFAVDDVFSENTSPTGAEALAFTTYVGVDAGF